MLRNLKAKVRRALDTLTRRHGRSPRVPLALAKYLRGRSHVGLIDVGAHRGEFTRAVDRSFRISRGILVEPQPELAQRLSALFAQPRFRVVAAAAWNRAGIVDLEINQFDATSSILKVRRQLPQLGGLDVRGKAIVQCPAMTLDSILADEEINAFDLLKIDVQGAEHLVIGGARTALQRVRLIWTEVSFVRLYDGSCLFNQVHDLLSESGFRLLELENAFRAPDGELLQSDALFSR